MVDWCRIEARRTSYGPATLAGITQYVERAWAAARPEVEESAARPVAVPAPRSGELRSLTGEFVRAFRAGGDLGAQVGVGVDELARDRGLAGDRGDAELLTGGQPGVDGGDDPLAPELAVEAPGGGHRLAPCVHPPAAGRGTRVGRAGRVMPL